MLYVLLFSCFFFVCFAFVGMGVFGGRFSYCSQVSLASRRRLLPCPALTERCRRMQGGLDKVECHGSWMVYSGQQRFLGPCMHSLLSCAALAQLTDTWLCTVGLCSALHSACLEMMAVRV